jgi:hypothetical protein
VLTGSIQRTRSQVRFNVALSDGATGEQQWAKRYDHELTAENLFEIQADIARQVATALQVRLTPEQQAALARPMTTNLAALDLYYRVLRWPSRASGGSHAGGRGYGPAALAAAQSSATSGSRTTRLRVGALGPCSNPCNRSR